MEFLVDGINTHATENKGFNLDDIEDDFELA